MPSSEGLELDLAISLGYPEEQIVAMDKSINVLYFSEWSKKYPRVRKAYGDISKGIHNVLKPGEEVLLSNLDLCGQVSTKTVNAIEGFIKNTPLSEKAICAITISNGREKGFEEIKADGLKNKDTEVGCFANIRNSALHYRATTLKGKTSKLVKENSYRQSRRGFTMSYMILELK